MSKLIDEYFDYILAQDYNKPGHHVSKRIVYEILHDLTDRRGLRQQWEQIDLDIQEEILTKWLGIVDALLVETKE